jgi:hypothetical protein
MYVNLNVQIGSVAYAATEVVLDDGKLMVVLDDPENEQGPAAPIGRIELDAEMLENRRVRIQADG